MNPRYWKRHVYLKGITTIERAEELRDGPPSMRYPRYPNAVIERTSGGDFRLVKMTPVWR